MIEYKMEVTQKEWFFLLGQNLSFWTLNKGDNSNLYDILFPDESEFIRAQTLLDVIDEY